MNKRKMNMSFKYIAVVLAVIFVLTGCQDTSSKTSRQSSDGGKMSDSEIVSDSNEGEMAVVPDNLSHEETLFFTGYGGKQISISPEDTAVRIYLTSKKDMEQLSKLTWIKELNLTVSKACSITDLECIGNLTQLEDLHISYEDISDISALAEFQNLKNLCLIGNKIQDISPLAGLKNLEELRLQSNQIEDLSPLSNLEKLSFLALDGNPIRDISPLENLDKDIYLSLEGTNLAWNDWEPIKHIGTVYGRPPVENAGTILCPQDWIDRIQSAYPDGMIISLDYDDYDGNGTYEAFAFVSDDSEPFTSVSGYEGALLMVTGDSVQELKRSWQLEVGGYYRFGNTKVIFLEDYDAFTSSTSYIWTAEGEKPRSMNLSGWGQWFYMDEFGNVCVRHSAYDGSSEHMGHSYKPYFFYFDGRDFVEYGAIPITEEEFLRCGGAEEVLEEIEEEGLTLTNILYRGNGMIHINLRKYAEEEELNEVEKTSQEEESDENDTRYYDNKYKTFHLSDDGQLTQTDSDMGVYYEYLTGTGGMAAGILLETVPVEYPSCFPIQ